MIRQIGTQSAHEFLKKERSLNGTRPIKRQSINGLQQEKPLTNQTLINVAGRKRKDTVNWFAELKADFHAQ